jgi:hypothetical protein
VTRQIGAVLHQRADDLHRVGACAGTPTTRGRGSRGPADACSAAPPAAKAPAPASRFLRVTSSLMVGESPESGFARQPTIRPGVLISRIGANGGVRST